MPALVLVVMVVFGWAFYVFTSAEKGSMTEYVGMAQNDLSYAYHDAEKEILIYQTILEFKTGEGIKELAFNGGYFGDSKKYGGWQHSYWEHGGNSYYPDKEILYENLGFYLNKELNDYLESYNENLVNEFRFEFIEEEERLKVRVKVDKEKQIRGEGYSGTVKVRDFTFYIDYNFDEFLEEVERIKGEAGKCQDNYECWQKIQDLDFEESNGIYSVEVPIKEYKDDYGEEEIIIRAALDFRDLSSIS